MADLTINFSFETEDRISNYRRLADKNNDGLVTVDEVENKELVNANLALNGVTLPGINGLAGVKVVENTSAADVSSGLGFGTGVVSNRSLPSTSRSLQEVQSSEMNTGDASNFIRLRAAGLTQKQLTNEKNIFVHLGQNQDGKDQYGFYSTGYGVGDERAGVVTVGDDGKISSKSLGAHWDHASQDQKKVLKDAYEARETLINQKFAGKFDNYSKFEKARSQVDDLLARGDIVYEDRKKLAELKNKMDPSATGFNHTQVTQSAEPLLTAHQSKLTDIQKKEASGILGDSFNADKDDINTKLTEATNNINKLDSNEDFTNKLNSFQDKLKGLEHSSDPEVKAFLAANKYLQGVKSNPDKSSLAELEWQNARFERMMKEDQAFKAEVEKSNPQPSAPSKPSAPSSPSATPEPKYEAIQGADNIAKYLGFSYKQSGSDLQSFLFANGSGSNGLQHQTIQGDPTKILLDRNNEHFLYDATNQTATKLQAVDGSDDVFYSPKEPGSVLLKSATGVESKKLNLHNEVDFKHNTNEYIYDSWTSKWIIKAK
jgi:hypothetical protein